LDTAKNFICYSQDGVASGYVAFVLYKSNFKGANYDGSFDEWVD
jgi:3-mercaptopyruvate sulfurtransferase SseA